MRQTRLLAAAEILVALVSLASVVSAGDGVIEISQASIQAGGGFPFVIGESGSYVLTSNLDVADPGADAIAVAADQVSLSLNGFRISGPAVCSGSAPTISCTPGTGVGVRSSGVDTTVRDGSVTGFPGGGLLLGEEATVERLRVAANGGNGLVVGNLARVERSRIVENAGDGIATGSDGFLRGNTVSFNNGLGIVAGIGTGYAGNVINQNGAGPASGGIGFVGNVCDSASCDCLPSAEVCDGLDNDCDGAADEDFLVGGVYGLDTHCGTCGTDCTLLSAPNAHWHCDVSGAPTCSLTCCSVGDPDPACDGVADYFDFNGLPADGCEQALNPDAIYVSTTDPLADDGPGCGRGPSGSGERPCLSIGVGIAEAAAAGRSEVLVAAGGYAETVQLVEGISVRGGYNPVSWARDPTANIAALLGSTPAGHRKTVIADGILLSPTTLDGLHVWGQNAGASALNSYAIWVRNSGAALSITGNVIFAGNGGPGAGGTAGVPGSNGAPGGAGAGAFDTGTNCFAECAAGGFGNPGGAGGASVCPDGDHSGGAGGTGVCPDWDEDSDGCFACPSVPFTQTLGTNSGSSGGGALGGTGGPGGCDSFSDPVCTSLGCSTVVTPESIVGCEVLGSGAGGGSAGSPGGHGSEGSGCTVPSGGVSSDEWSGVAGTSGQPGLGGGGGGGGGAGGGVEQFLTASCPQDGASDLGGSGGGGGGGGCGGDPGFGGSSGGGSFAIFVSFSTDPAGNVPTISANELHRGFGGSGGPGGTGGGGGVGGAGGSGGATGLGSSFGAAGGGDGGIGGSGGAGGGGGGGCGGVAYAIFAAGQGGTDLSSWTAGNVFAGGGGAGAGGAGGPTAPGGSPGSAGAPGALADTNF